MADFPLLPLIIISVLLLLLSTLFSVSESSFLAMNKLKLRMRRKEGNKRAVRSAKLLEKKEELINTLLVGNDLVNILLSSIITAVAIKLFGEKGVALATFIVTIFLLIFGEITPKTISTRNPDGIAYFLSLFVKIVVIILKPFVFIFTLVSRISLKIMGVNFKDPDHSYSEEDIKSFIDAGAETGILESGENKMMNSVFKFSDLEAENIMIPRTAIVAFKDNASYTEVLEIAQRTRFSYFPVYGENLDDIKGILYLKDLLKYNQSNFNIKVVMRPAVFIPGTKKISSVQNMFREQNISFAIVIDEYSGTDGIITKEDIIRQIFGKNEASRPWRNPTEVSEIESKDKFSLDGTTLLKDIKELVGIELTSSVNETLGGWIIEKLGRLAMPYDSVTYEGVIFTVEDILNRRIKSVKIERKKEELEDD